MHDRGGGPAKFLGEFCRTTLGTLGEGAVREGVDAIRERLEGSLTIAVAGRVSCGKSTLVNALLGRKIAATDARECTKAVARYRQGKPEQMVVRMRDGRVLPPRSLATAQPLSDLGGADASEVELVDVTLANARLAAQQILDTPGLASAAGYGAGGDRETSWMHQDSTSAVSQSDAVVYLISHGAASQADVEALDAMGMTAMTTIAVLAKADTVGGGGSDSLAAATELADRMQVQLRGRVRRVLPLIGLIAESVECGRPTEEDAFHLGLLAHVPSELRRLWLSSRDLLEAQVDLSVSIRRALHDQLGMFGLLRCLDWIDEGVQGAIHLQRRLRELSGLESLRDALGADFESQAAPLKAEWALRELERLSFDRTDPENARALRPLLEESMERLRDDPAMFQLEEMRALRIVLADRTLPEDLREDALRLFDERQAPAKLGLPEDAAGEEIAAAAVAGARRWTAYENDFRSSSDGRRVAESARRSYLRVMRLTSRADV